MVCFQEKFCDLDLIFCKFPIFFKIIFTLYFAKFCFLRKKFFLYQYTKNVALSILVQKIV